MNAYSIIHNYGEPTYSPDFNLINTALASKQQALNTNRQKLNSLYDQFNSLQVVKDVDKEYIDNRLRSIADINSPYHNMDLSDENFATAVLGNVSQFLDDKVKNAVYSTNKIAAEDKVWEEKRNDPKANYAEVNHRYALAMSDRKRYLTSEATGDKYLGGANFIEYTDYRKMITEKMPQIADKLKVKWIQTGPSSGYFESIDTYEGVSKDKLKTVLSTMLGEKELKQMEIDAWNKYDSLPTEELSTQYQNYYQNVSDDLSSTLKGLQDRLKVTTDEKEKSILQQQIAVTEQNIDFSNTKMSQPLTDQSKRLFYTSIFKESFIDDVAEAYSTVSHVDRKIDETKARDVEFQYKMAQDVLKNDREERKLALKEKKGEEDQANSVLYTMDKQSYPDAMESVMLQKLKVEDEAKKQFSQLFGGLPATDQYSELTSKFNELPSLIKRKARGEKVTFRYNGKDVELTDQNIKILQNFQNTVLEESVNDKKLDGWANDLVRDGAHRLSKLVANSKEFGGKGADINPFRLMNFGWKIDENMKVVSTKEGSHYHAILLAKLGKNGWNGMTKAEKATLQTYQTVAIVADAQNLGLNPTQTRIIFEAQRKKAIFEYGMSSSEFKKIGGDYQEIYDKARILKRAKGRDFNFVRSMPMIEGSYTEYNLSAITSSDAEFYNDKGKEVSLKGTKSFFKDAVNFANETLVAELESEQGLSQFFNPVIQSNHPKFKELTSLLQSKDANVMIDNKQPYEIVGGADNSETLTVKFSRKGGKGEPSVVRDVTSVSRTEIEKLFGQKFAVKTDTPYNARTSGAKPIVFGTPDFRGNDVDMVQANIGVYAEAIAELPNRDQIGNLMNMYFDQKLKFSYERNPDFLVYEGVIRDLSGNIIGKSGPVDTERFEIDEAINLQKNGDKVASAIMVGYLNNEIQRQQNISTINKAKENVKTYYNAQR